MAENEPKQNSVGKQAANQAKEFAKQKAKEQIKKMAAKKGLATALAPVLFWAAVIILIIILLTGIIAFLLTAPGLVTGKLKDFAVSLGRNIASYFGADATKFKDEDEEYRVLDYLENMGYDLKGYGFISKDVDDKDNANYDEVQGVIRDPDTGKIKEANSLLVELYLMSDTYVYTAKNFNKAAGDNFWSGLANFLRQANRILNPLFQGLVDTIFNTDAAGEWGRGLLSIYFEDGAWHKGKDYEKSWVSELFGADLDWTGIEIDADSKKLKIRRGWGANYYEYELDGWTGRYGMPLEFLLSVQIATLKPDLAYEMVTGFETDVLILLRDISSGSQIIASYKTSNDKYITYQSIDEIIHFTDDGKSDSWWEKFLGFFDDWVLTDTEKEELVKLGLPDDKDRIKAILSELKDVNDYNFKTYVPFLSRVTDHWYRDVYFVVGADENDAINYNGIYQDGKTRTSIGADWWVKTDLDYQALTNERWTEYERYTEGDKKGEYKLYVYEDPSGEYNYGDLFEGTQQDANTRNIRVYKKAETGSIDSLFEEGLVNEKINDRVWTAYESKNTGGGKTDYKKLYPDEPDSTDKGKLYYNEVLSGNVKQVNEAVRRETNPKIKNMFMSRRYFTYDGTAPRAEQIMQIREKMREMGGSFKSINNKDISYSNYQYGAVPEELLEGDGTTFTINDTQHPGETIDVNLKDIVTQVSLNQDSLAAFSMLENTHTEDADFIYRDFKELIVELGFFEKEDLTEGNPRQLQWVVPDIGSSGYPYRYIDKDADLLGTKVHSKEDINAAKQKLMTELISQLGDEFGDDGAPVDGIDQTPVSGLELLRNDPRINNEVGDILETSDGSVKCSQVTVEEFLETAREMCEMINEEGYDYCVYHLAKNCPTCSPECKALSDTNFGNCAGKVGNGACDCGENHCKHNPHSNGCTLKTTFMQSFDNMGYHNTCCATLVSWALQNVGVMPDSAHQNGAESLATWIQNNLDPELIQVGEPLEPGDILCYDGHIDLVGEEIDSGFVKYNGGNWVKIGAVEPGPNSCIQHITGWPSDPRIKFALRLPWKKSHPDPKPYVGYVGNEAVVSPVTGILLEYGTYTDEDGENGYRNNTDRFVKEEHKKDPEKLGYAKILVLSKEISDQFVKISPNGDEGEGSAVKIKAPASTDEMDDWSDSQKALYGYGLFADNYEKAKIATDTTGDEKDATSKQGRYENIPSTTHGIAGYIVYVDGFVLETPNWDAEGYVYEKDQIKQGAAKKDDQRDPDMPINGGGHTLSWDVLNSHAYSIGGAYENKNLYDVTLYEMDDVYKMESKSVQDKEEAKAEGKDMAVNVLKWHGTVNGDTKDWLIIKEGTVLGRTMSNRELMEKVRGLSNYKSPKELTPEEKKDPPMYGNYLRMIFKDRDDNNVENIEDYIKLDEIVIDNENDWELFYWLPFESGAADTQKKASGHYTGPVCVSSCSTGEIAIGIVQWTSIDKGKGDKDMCNQRDQYFPWMKENYPQFYSSELADWGASDYWDDWTSGSKHVDEILKRMDDKDHETFLHAQMECAKENYLEPLLEKHPWLKSRPSCVQGEIMHLRLWGADTSDLDSHKSDTNKEILAYVRHKIANTSSTAGAATGDEESGRAWNEPEIGFGILDHKITKSEIEDWVRSDDVSILTNCGIEYR